MGVHLDVGRCCGGVVGHLVDFICPWVAWCLLRLVRSVPKVRCS